MTNDYTEQAKFLLSSNANGEPLIYELVKDGPMAVYILKQDGTCIFENQAMKNMLGDYEGKAVGINVFELENIKQSPILQGFKRCLAGENVKLKNLKYSSGVTGKELVVDVSLIPVGSGDNKAIVAFYYDALGNVKNLLEQKIKSLEAERDFSYTLLNNTPIAIFAFNKEGRIFSVNKAVGKLLGDEKINLIGQNAFEFKSVISSRLPYLLKRSVKGTPFSGELHVLYRKTNKDMVLDFQITPIFKPDTTVDYVIVMFSDVTEKFYIRKSLQDDLLLARKIQKSIISEKHLDDIPEINFFIHYQPMGEVGGDFYDISKIMPSKKIRILVTDATGHGVQGALTTMLIKSEYEKVKIFDLPPHRVLDIVNNNFCALYPNMRIYFTCFIADIDLSEGVIQYSAAGHPGQFLQRGNEIFTMSCKGRYLGIFEKSEYELKKIEIQKNDRLFLFTDGLFEEFSDSDEIFGHENLKEVIRDSWHKDLTQHSRNIIMDVFSFKGWREINDDITFIVADI